MPSRGSLPLVVAEVVAAGVGRTGATGRTRRASNILCTHWGVISILVVLAYLG